MLAQQILLLPRRPRIVSLLPPLRPRTPPERARQLARTALQHRGHRVARAGGRDAGGLGQQVEVEEFDELQLYFARGAARFEERSYGEETIKGLEGARIGGLAEEGADERV
jgi:hypothetical protein